VSIGTKILFWFDGGDRGRKNGRCPQSISVPIFLHRSQNPTLPKSELHEQSILNRHARMKYVCANCAASLTRSGRSRPWSRARFGVARLKAGAGFPTLPINIDPWKVQGRVYNQSIQAIKSLIR